MMRRIIDSHQHFWKYDPQEYGWIGPHMKAIRRDFLPEDLKTETKFAAVDQSIAVQARSTLDETAWLLQLAETSDGIAGVVGWVPLSAPDAESHIERFAAHPKFAGMRHVVQDEPDDRYLLRSDFNAGIAQLRRFGLAYDVLIFEKHLGAAIEFVDRHPSQIFVLDHIAKPRIRDRALSPWRENIQELARRPNVYCKFSGVVTEADWETWKPADLAPYFDIVLNAFTPERLMFGSDWPVLLLAGTYQGWFSHVKNAIAELTEAEQNRILGETAEEAYKLLCGAGPRPAPGASPGSSDIQQDQNSAPEGHAQATRLPHKNK